MANPTNTIDRTKSLAATLAEAVGDGTRANIVGTLKVDEAGKEADATDQYRCAAQLSLNSYDDAYQRVVELWYQHRKVWAAANLAALQAYGSDDNLTVGDLGFDTATWTIRRCVSVDGAAASTWAAVTATPTAHGASHASNGSDPIPAGTTSVRGTLALAASGGTGAGVAVQGNDARLAAATTSNRGTVLLAASGGTGANTAVQGNDARLAAATTSNRGTVQLAPDGGVTAGQAVQANDSRLAASSYSRVSGSTARGSANVRIYRWTAEVESGGSAITYTDSSTVGGYWLVSESGTYSVSVTQEVSATTNAIAIKTDTPAGMNSTFDTDAVRQMVSDSRVPSVSWTGYVPAGNRIWIATSDAVDPSGSYTNARQVTVTKVR